MKVIMKNNFKINQCKSRRLIIIFHLLNNQQEISLFYKILLV